MRLRTPSSREIWGHPEVAVCALAALHPVGSDHPSLRHTNVASFATIWATAVGRLLPAESHPKGYWTVHKDVYDIKSMLVARQRVLGGNNTQMTGGGNWMVKS